MQAPVLPNCGKLDIPSARKGVAFLPAMATPLQIRRFACLKMVWIKVKCASQRVEASRASRCNRHLDEFTLWAIAVTDRLDSNALGGADVRRRYKRLLPARVFVRIT